MTKRQLFLETIKRKRQDYIPFDFDLCPALEEEFTQRTGLEDYKDYYQMPLRFCYAPCRIPEKDNRHFARYYDNPPEQMTFSEWGIGVLPGSVAHFVQMFHPMEHLDTPEQILTYPYPDPVADYNWEYVKKKVSMLKAKDTVVFASMGATIFELAWVLRSMEELFIDMVERPEMAEALLDAILRFKLRFVELYVEAGVDGFQFGDDVGSQLDLMMSPELWRKYLKPRLSQVIRRAKELNPNVMVEYHSDGNIERIIPELIEVGVEILNPVQPECMDPVKIKEQYGSRLSFRGCLGTQTVMPFGTPQQVSDTCRRLIRDVGKGGGLILSPSHVLEPEVPWENIEAYISAVQAANRKAGYE